MTQEKSVNNTTEDDEISLKELILKVREWWKYLLSKWYIIFIAGVIGGGLGLAYAWKQKTIYTATTTFVLESGEKAGGLGQFAGMASMMGVDLGGGGGGIFQGDNILELYKSRMMLTQALFSPLDSGSKEPLIEKYIQVNEMRKGWEAKDELKGIKFTTEDLKWIGASNSKDRLRDSIVGKIVRNIVSNNLLVEKPDKKLGIISVKIKSLDEIFSKRFNEELVKNVNLFYINTKTQKSLSNVKILQRKTDSVRAVMNGAIYSAVAAVDATPNLNPTRQTQRVAPAQKSQFSAETNKAVLSTLVQNLEMSKMSLLKETPLIQLLDYPIYPLTKEKLGKLKGLIIGGALMVFISLFLLVIRRSIIFILK